MEHCSKLESVELLTRQVLERARCLYSLDRYSEAVSAFLQCIALTEGQPRLQPSLEQLESSGVMLHNIASCHHHMGRYDVALVFYELAAANFQQAIRESESPLFVDIRGLLSDGCVNQRRLQFVNQRLEDVHHSRVPDKQVYLDASGYRHTVVANEETREEAASCAAAAQDLCSKTPTPLASIPNALLSISGPCESAIGRPESHIRSHLRYFRDGDAIWFRSV